VSCQVSYIELYKVARYGTGPDSPLTAKLEEQGKHAKFKRRKERGKSGKRQTEKVDGRQVLSDVCYAICVVGMLYLLSEGHDVERGPV
jgi:hypothetical protein